MMLFLGGWTMTKQNSIKLAKQEHQQKLSLKKKIAQYYQQQQQKYGLQPLDKIKAYLPEEYQPLAMRRDIAIAHLDLEPILELMAEEKKFSVVSGLNPSSPLHLGHKVLFDLLKELQQMGGELFIPITNDESYLDGKARSIKGSTQMAIKQVMPAFNIFGFKTHKTHLFLSSQDHELYLFALKISKLVKTTALRAMFGKEALSNVGQHFYRGALQIAQILMPQLPDYGGPRHTLIPVGIDQHPYILLARDVAKELDMIPPSELVIKFQPSLSHPEKKMSGSKPKTAIYLSDTKQQVKSKINKAYTGSVAVLKVHQELGGFPEICSVFSLLLNHHPDDEYVQLIRTKYLRGQITMRALKNKTSTFINQLLEKYQALVAD
jgi:tryptophanyl-tRNA synthetase